MSVGSRVEPLEASVRRATRAHFGREAKSRKWPESESERPTWLDYGLREENESNVSLSINSLGYRRDYSTGPEQSAAD